MWDLWTGKKYTPFEARFSSDERLYLGDYDVWQAVLCFRDWELRIYTYNFHDSDDIGDIGQWRDSLCNKFGNFSWSYEVDSLGYIVVETKGWLDEVVADITKVCRTCLDYFSPFGRDDMSSFIKKWLPKIKTFVRVYTYYK